MSKLSLIVPTHGGNIANIWRTISSVRSFVDDVVVVSTCIFWKDQLDLKEVANTIVELPWNTVFKEGFAFPHNAGIPSCKNRWIILLGCAETIAEQYQSIEAVTSEAPPDQFFLLDHHNDSNRWGRIWCRDSNVKWGGLIHEALGGGRQMGVIARMQDTDKTPMDNRNQQEILRWFKVVSYNVNYHRLLHDSGLLGFSDRGWLAFVNGAKESIEAFWNEHQDLIQPCLHGDLTAFLNACHKRMDMGDEANQVNFNPTGQEMSAGA